MIGDRLFVVGIVKAARIQAQLYKSPVYMYQFGYRGEHSLSEVFAKSNENYGEWKIVGETDPSGMDRVQLIHEL